MTNEQQIRRPDVGTFQFEVYGNSKVRRACCTRFKVRCDAIGLHSSEILLLSVLGPETSVKALTAGLRSSVKDQKRIDYSVQVDGLNENHLIKCPDGYRVYRTKLDYGFWHVLCLAKRNGFIPAINDETVWQHLQSDQFTTPLLRDWVPWLYREMTNQKHIIELEQKGCQAALLVACAPYEIASAFWR